jgi:DNA-binding response OmpR family regulator
MANVLLIEPDRVLADTYMQALQHAGHSVVRVASAQAAIGAADSTLPDVVVLELQLAVHDGIEFLHEFRSYGEWQETPVIVNTYLTPQAIAPVARALQEDLGVKICLYKPRASLEKLIKTVNEYTAVS